MNRLKPICVPCQRFFRVERNGYRFTEGMPNGQWPMGMGPTPPGKEHDEYWQPYKIWQGDLWRCEGCGAEIISGVAAEPVGERHMVHFDDVRREGGYDQLQVNDC
jgi:hypothetical protein